MPLQKLLYLYIRFRKRRKQKIWVVCLTAHFRVVFKYQGVADSIFSAGWHRTAKWMRRCVIKGFIPSTFGHPFPSTTQTLLGPTHNTPNLFDPQGVLHSPP